MKRALIVGCGYTGIRLAARLLEMGLRVSGTSRREQRLREMEDAGIEPLEGALNEVATIERMRVLAPSLVAYFVPPQKTGPDPLSAILATMADPPLEAFLYASSSSLYGDHDGDWVDENTPVTPNDPDDEARFAAERLVTDTGQASGFPTRICRITGIYGPGRTLRGPLQSGSYALVQGHDTWVNRIHVDDLVTSLIAAWQMGQDGRIYNLVDARPHRASEFANLAADLSGLPRPAWIDVEEARLRYRPRALRRKLANKRVRCFRLRQELHVQLKYPDYRAGLPAAVSADRVG